MTWRSVRLTARPPNAVERLWYRRLGLEPPLAVSGAGIGGLARLVPYRWRWFHHGFAAVGGYYWLPCPLCDRLHGGHESSESIPDPTCHEDTEMMICSECTRRRNVRT